MKWEDYTDEQLEHYKGVMWDDWNFGTGSQDSFNAIEAIEAEQKKRDRDKASFVHGLMAGTTWHEPDNPPDNPVEGSCYFDTTDGVVYVWANGKWAQMTGPSALATALP